MPTKNFSGSLINYGTALPPAATTPDGALFFKVGGVDEGLYLFSFISDTNLGTLGDQAGQNWVPLTGTSSTIDADTLDGLDSSAFQLSSPLLSSISSLGTNGILVKDSAGTVITRSVVPGSANRIAVSDGNGVGGNISLDVVEGNLNLANMGGVLPVTKGGTGNNASVIGGVVYGATASQLAFTSVGTAGHLLQSGGTGAPSWLNPASLTVGTANYANSAGTAGSATTAGSLSPGASIDIVGPAGNTGYFQADAVTFTGASNVSIAVNSINSNLLTASIPTDLVLWNRISNLDTGLRTFTGWPIATTTTYSRPSLFYDMGGNSVTSNPSMQPADFLSRSLTGFDAYNTDMGFYQVGITVVGGTSGAKSLQLAANWDSEETTPFRQLRYRVNDDNGVVATWGPWRYIVDEGSPVLSTFVLKAGDTMTGPLKTTALAVGDVSFPGTGSINMTGNLTLLGIDGTGFVSAAGNLISTTGNISATVGNVVAGNYVQAGAGGGSVSGTIRMQSSGSGNSGYLEFWPGNDIRAGYIGNTGATGSTDGGGINYVSGFHAFTGNMTVTGNISAQGNVTAYAPSDGRLKRDIVTISDAMAKVKALRGVDYTMKDSGRRETGLIAQEVLQVVPEVVREGSDGVYGVSYGNLVGLLIEAIKEQQQQIDELKAQLNK